MLCMYAPIINGTILCDVTRLECNWPVPDVHFVGWTFLEIGTYRVAVGGRFWR
jgi:hypothetical protein